MVSEVSVILLCFKFPVIERGVYVPCSCIHNSCQVIMEDSFHGSLRGKHQYFTLGQ